jgi:hypothetical protein
MSFNSLTRCLMYFYFHNWKLTWHFWTLGMSSCFWLSVIRLLRGLLLCLFCEHQLVLVQWLKANLRWVEVELTCRWCARAKYSPSAFAEADLCKWDLNRPSGRWEGVGLLWRGACTLRAASPPRSCWHRAWSSTSGMCSIECMLLV